MATSQSNSNSLLLRGVKDKAQKAAFKKLQKQVLALGLKTDLPQTVTQYKKSYTASKKFAESDYYFEWTKEIAKFYNKVGKKASKVIEKEKLDLHPRTTFSKRAGSHEGTTTALVNLSESLKTLSNITNPEYLNGEMSKQEKSKLVKRKQEMTIVDDGEVSRQHVVTKAGLVSTKRKPVTINTFGGSLVKLAYNNYLVALSNMGYVKSLNTVLSMSPSEWNEVYKQYSDRLEPLFKYKEFTASGSDEYFNSLFTGEYLDGADMEYEDEEDF